VGKRLRALKLETHEAYLNVLKKDQNGDELVNLLDAISTNVTSFFREADHFVFVSKVFAEWIAAGQTRFRFWSAACSSGEEPYSLAMKLLEVADGRPLDMKILGTDISTKVLAHCLSGIYDEGRLETVPRQLLVKYFDKQTDQNGGVQWKVKASLSNLTVFRRLNLSTPPFLMKGPLDIVFCRNVMIYFDKEVRSRLISEIFRLLKPGGYLLVGHAESLTGLETGFKPVMPSVYVKK
jgi:chemotaxis protein methyltransferase CheR